MLIHFTLRCITNYIIDLRESAPVLIYVKETVSSSVDLSDDQSKRKQIHLSDFAKIVLLICSLHEVFNGLANYIMDKRG
jgi:hypothetical protein